MRHLTKCMGVLSALISALVGRQGMHKHTSNNAGMYGCKHISPLLDCGIMLSARQRLLGNGSTYLVLLFGSHFNRTLAGCCDISVQKSHLAQLLPRSQL